MLFYNNKDLERSNNFEDYVPLYGNDSLRVDLSADRMEACNWRFEDFTIEDMMLFAALAYQPTERLQDEINHFYPREANETKTMFIDLQHSQYQSHGYGNVTYFTLITKNSIVVSIRGEHRDSRPNGIEDVRCRNEIALRMVNRFRHVERSISLSNLIDSVSLVEALSRISDGTHYQTSLDLGTSGQQEFATTE